MDQQKRKEIARRSAAAMDRLDLPETLASDVPRLELQGNREFYMDRHRGILSYTTEAVDLNGGSVIVRLRGEDLQLVAMSDEEVRIVGTIAGLELLP